MLNQLLIHGTLPDIVSADDFEPNITSSLVPAQDNVIPFDSWIEKVDEAWRIMTHLKMPLIIYLSIFKKEKKNNLHKASHRRNKNFG